MEEAISKFVDGLERQERRGFTEIQTYLQRLPVPGSAEVREMTHAEAIEGHFLPTPCLYVAPAENMVGRVLLIPCFLAGNSTPTIPHKFSKRRDSGFPFGCADSAAVDERLGSNLYEVNPWLWQFGRGKPRLGGLPGLTVEQPETMERKSTVADEQHKKAAETKWRHKAATA